MELLLPLVLLLPLLFIMMRTRRQQREVVELQGRIAPGQEVMTTAGMYARVAAVDDAVVTLEIADGVRVRYARRAIGRIVSGDPAAAPRADTPPAG
jgi:preprotein translocase subunit YajC